ncbi:uncharacterized protein N7515_009621 [Penicillium bovifimosum]|uniref:Uncharacterized protein n=1 Tax=Penicillium bovifimosum TaxID=126998 RepID=A0A9W9GJY1_9EURO|nr:uncharacterized protein N7515_009621 [Penicillium bovifimosum]KAJ5121660.1 hypothetical protein N7515_009621 [Penicillium bovifimosum]
MVKLLKLTENNHAMVETTEEFQQVVRDFNLSPPTWWDKIRFHWGEKSWSCPEHLIYLWDDLRIITGRKGHKHPLFPLRTESLLLTLLAHKIIEQGLDTDGSITPPHWSFQCQFDRAGLNDGQSPALIDYVLWYGHHCELETNMIVMKSSNPASESWKLLENMALLHNTRKLARKDASIHGVMTDGSTWIFMHINNGSRYMIVKTLSWDKEQHRIIGRIEYIVSKAFHCHRETLAHSATRKNPVCRECGHHAAKKPVVETLAEKKLIPTSRPHHNSRRGCPVEKKPVAMASDGPKHSTPIHANSNAFFHSQMFFMPLANCFHASNKTK